MNLPMLTMQKPAIIQKKMNELSLYEAFDKGHYIHVEYISKVQNYITGNLISWSPNHSFWQAEYNYATKLYEVCPWRKECDMQPMVKKKKKDWQFVVTNL